MVADYTTGLYAYYKMNGDWTDSSGNGRDATASGSPTFAVDEFSSSNSSGSFSGASQYADTPSMNLGTSWSFVLRVYGPMSSGDTFLQAASGSDDFILGYQVVATSKVEVYYDVSGSNKTLSELSAISANTWTQYVVTCDGTTIRFYKDKVEQASIAAGSPNMPNWAFRIGGGVPSGNDFGGRMSHLAIYDGRALDSDTITGWYDNGDTWIASTPGVNSLFFGGPF